MKIDFWYKTTKKRKTILKQAVLLDGRVIPYTLTTSSQARHMRITIHRDGRLGVSIPRSLGKDRVDQFIKEKSTWILTKLDYFSSLSPTTLTFGTKKEYLAYKEKALLMAVEKIEKFNTLYKFSYNTIRIKNQKTLWGSCSRKGNLNFNYKIALLPTHLSDYIVVHELCHLMEFNHSKQFWDLVAKTIPTHSELRKELKSTGLRSI